MLLAGSVPRGLPALLAAAPLAWQVWNVRVPAREATHAAGERGAGLTLLRNFIHESLYHLKYGYFANRDVPVGRLTAPMAFNSLLGQDGYNYTLSRAYTRLQVGADERARCESAKHKPAAPSPSTTTTSIRQC